MKTTRWLLVTCLACALVVGAGCGETEEEVPPPIKSVVTGTVSAPSTFPVSPIKQIAISGYKNVPPGGSPDRLFKMITSDVPTIAYGTPWPFTLNDIGVTGPFHIVVIVYLSEKTTMPEAGTDYIGWTAEPTDLQGSEYAVGDILLHVY